MTNPDEPMFPAIPWDGSLQAAITPRGLTKREYFAAMAMRGLMQRASSITSFSDIAIGSLEMADILIAELNKEKA